VSRRLWTDLWKTADAGAVESGHQIASPLPFKALETPGNLENQVET